MLVRYAVMEGPEKSEEIFERVLKVTAALNAGKDASAYWYAINRTMLDHSPHLTQLWLDEKVAAQESIAVAKEESLAYLAGEREKIMRMTHEEALTELVRVHKIESRISVIRTMTDNNILGIK